MDIFARWRSGSSVRTFAPVSIVIVSAVWLLASCGASPADTETDAGPTQPAGEQTVAQADTGAPPALNALQLAENSLPPGLAQDPFWQPAIIEALPNGQSLEVLIRGGRLHHHIPNDVRVVLTGEAAEGQRLSIADLTAGTEVSPDHVQVLDPVETGDSSLQLTRRLQTDARRTMNLVLTLSDETGETLTRPLMLNVSAAPPPVVRFKPLHGSVDFTRDLRMSTLGGTVIVAAHEDLTQNMSDIARYPVAQVSFYLVNLEGRPVLSETVDMREKSFAEIPRGFRQQARRGFRLLIVADYKMPYVQAGERYSIVLNNRIN